MIEMNRFQHKLANLDMSYFASACKTKGKNGISHLISETA